LEPSDRRTPSWATGAGTGADRIRCATSTSEGLPVMPSSARARIRRSLFVPRTPLPPCSTTNRPTESMVVRCCRSALIRAFSRNRSGKYRARSRSVRSADVVGMPSTRSLGSGRLVRWSTTCLGIGLSEYGTVTSTMRPRIPSRFQSNPAVRCEASASTPAAKTAPLTLVCQVSGVTFR
jgi:hypothetical protein